MASLSGDVSANFGLNPMNQDVLESPLIAFCVGLIKKYALKKSAYLFPTIQ